MGIVDASKLPRDRSTLLVRFMAAGPLLPDAIADMAILEDDALERTVAEQILVDMEHVLGSKVGATPEEEEFVMSMQGTFKDARRLGRDEGLAEGEAKGEARALLTALRVRGIPVSDAARERILTERDPAQLDRWMERAILAASVAEVIEPSRAA